MENKEMRRDIDRNNDTDKGEGSQIQIGAGSQLYLGTPVGVVLCVDAVGGPHLNYIDALLWHGYSKEPIGVAVPEHMLRAMEDLFDTLNYPRPTTTLRSFSQGTPSGTTTSRSNLFGATSAPGTPSSVERCLNNEDLLEKRGKMATFIIRVQQRQNSNWQGRITWVERDRTVRFSTIMEMVKLIEKALEN